MWRMLRVAFMVSARKGCPDGMRLGRRGAKRLVGRVVMSRGCDGRHGVTVGSDGLPGLRRYIDGCRARWWLMRGRRWRRMDIALG